MMADQIRGRGQGDTGEFYATQRRTFPDWNGDDGYVEGDMPPFGYLLTLDLYRCDGEAITSIDACYTYMEEMVTALKMQRQAPPIVFWSPDDYSDKQGISAWVPLIESGITVHTLAVKRFASIDVYCCHKFDVDTVLAMSKLYFKPHDVELHEIKRGVRYHAA